MGRTQPGCTGCGGAGVPPPDSGSPGAPGNAGTALEGTPGPPYSSAARVHAGSHRGPAGPAPAPWPGVWRPVTCEKSCAGCSCPDERCWLRTSGSEFEFDPEGDSRQRGLGRVLRQRQEGTCRRGRGERLHSLTGKARGQEGGPWCGAHAGRAPCREAEGAAWGGPVLMEAAVTARSRC